jgi:acetylornithine deacetylase/succinyl-diaminopimelate desuccinylase-like protein
LAVIGIAQDSPRLASVLAPSGVSFERIRADLEQLAFRPRAVSTGGHAAARAYLVARLEGMGLHPEIQATLGRDDKSRTAAWIENVAVRIPGRASSRAVMLTAHDDSVFNSPGCADNAAAVAALLDTIRVALSGAPLRNDLIVLFTDGEELGRLGARAFADGHPWMRDIELVFVFDAGGVSGPPVMWETSDGDGWIVREFARAVPFAVANSCTRSACCR